MTPSNDGDAPAPLTPPDDAANFGVSQASGSAQQQAIAPSAFDPDSAAPAPPAYADTLPLAQAPTDLSANPSPYIDQPLFASYAQPPVRRPVRIPHFGHLLLLSLLIVVAFAIAVVVAAVDYVLVAHFNHSAAQSFKDLSTNVGFNLMFETVLYFGTFGIALFVFPMIWNEGYFAGLQWRGDVARSKFWLLLSIAAFCFGLAILDQVVLPGPANAPIDKMISSPGAAWLMFAFGVTVAPFFEEMLFRGFLLPALCTAFDWIGEKIRHAPPLPLDASGHPQWSMPAMIVASIATSAPFALLHREQQGNSLGPFLLLIVISTILCAVRLKTRSLAASTLVHATYNFLLFMVELAVTGGFRHFDKM
jgi:membrane protease YdiL (CAAX protease family)